MNITSNEELREWLSTKPLDWAVTIAVRAALRALPLLNVSDDWLTFDSVLPFRALGIAWAGCDLPTHDMQKPTHSAAYYSHLNNVSRYAGYATAQGPNAVNDAMRAISDSASNPAFWEMVVNDCQWLIDGKQIAETSSALTRCPLWFVEPPENWLGQWQELKARLLAFDPNYVVWTEWFDRRINGHDAAFDIPGDKDRLEDKKILLRLADATDMDFWAKGPEYINATMRIWLLEARARVAPVSLDEAETTAPPQDARATAYGVNREGKVDRLPPSDQVHLRDEPNQRRAYSDLREVAAGLLDEGQRLGHRLQRALNRFLHSLPDSFENAEAYLVWRDANALRRLHRAHREAAKSPEPDEAKLEPVIAEGLGGLLDLYNNFAFADDGLRAKDEARIAPQERTNAEAEATAAIPLVRAILANPEIATPEALDDIVANTEDAELPADDAYADQVLDQSNRSKRNIVAGLISDTWAAFKNANPLMQGLVVNAAYDGVKLTALVIGGIEYAPLLDFIAINASALTEYVAIAFANYPDLPGLIERIKIAWQSRR